MPLRHPFTATQVARVFWDNSSSSMASPSPSSAIATRFSPAHSGMICLLAQAPSSSTTRLTTHRRMAKANASTSAWKCTCIVPFTTTPRNGVAGFLPLNSGTTPRFTHLSAALPSKLCMGSKQMREAWPPGRRPSHPCQTASSGLGGASREFARTSDTRTSQAQEVR